MYIKVKVRTKQKREAVRVLSIDHIEVDVRVPAERGLANKWVLVLLREYYHIQNIRLVNGHHSPHKIVNIEKEE
jgi:uncharacterized protein (TIGR00251 family)